MAENIESAREKIRAAAQRLAAEEAEGKAGARRTPPAAPPPPSASSPGPASWTAPRPAAPAFPSQPAPAGGLAPSYAHDGQGRRWGFVAGLIALGVVVAAGIVALALVLALGGGSEDGEDSSTVTARRATLQELFSSAGGYRLDELPSSVMERMRSDLMGAPALQAMTADLQGRTVTKGGETVGVMVGIQVDEQVGALPTAGSRFLEAATEGGQPWQETTVDGERAVYMEDATDDLRSLIVYENGVGFGIVGQFDETSESELKDFAGVLLDNI